MQANPRYISSKPHHEILKSIKSLKSSKLSLRKTWTANFITKQTSCPRMRLSNFEISVRTCCGLCLVDSFQCEASCSKKSQIFDDTWAFDRQYWAPRVLNLRVRKKNLKLLYCLEISLQCIANCVATHLNRISRQGCISPKREKS